MSVKIRLRRMGKKKQPHYRIVVADSRSPRDGRFVENLGYYNPVTHPARLRVDLERVDYWLGEGAIPSRTVESLVGKARAGGDEKVALDVDRDAAVEGDAGSVEAAGEAGSPEGQAGSAGSDAGSPEGEAASAGAGAANGAAASAAEARDSAGSPEDTAD